MAKHALQRIQSENHAYSHFVRPTAIALAVAACFGGPARANPTAPTVVHGTASFNQAGNILNITNSHNAIINWGSFSIGLNELTKFIQPSALSAVLNRVTGQDPSQILGALQSNGRVFLINPNGIVFGAGSQINVAGLVASTLNLSNEDFLNNRMRFTDGAGAGSVVNNGSITGGSVYLVGNAVANNGLITSPNGEVVLAAGNSVELVNPGTPDLRVEVVAPDNEARNLGTITAEAGRIGIYAGLISNSGMLNASSAVSEGGRILLKAKKDITLTSGSVIDASGKGGGEIIALADNNTYVDGTLKASAPASGNGGFIETSGKNRVKIADSAIIDTTAAQGKTGIWLIDPSDFVIAAYGGDTTGAAISSQLSGTNVVIHSNNGSGQYGGGNGDILVNDSINWFNSNSLTLTAVRNVEVNQSINNSSGEYAYGGGLNLYAGWNGVGDGSTPALTAGVGSINVNASISASTINMAAGGAVNIDAPVTAYGYPSCCSIGPGGNATINIAGNSVTISAPVGAYGGDGSEGGAGGSAAITVAANNGITVNSDVRAYGGEGGGSYSGGGQGGAASVTLTNTGSSSSVQINSGAQILAEGGEGGSAYYNGGAGGKATVALNSSGGLSINGSVRADGGEGASGYTGNGGRGGDGVVNAIVSGILNIGAYGGVIGQGGTGGYAEGGEGGNTTAGRGGDGKVSITAGTITVANGGQVEGQGGQGGQGGYSYSYGQGRGGNGGDGIVQLTSTGNMGIMGSVSAGGGWGGEGGEGAPSGGGGNASVSLVSTGGNLMISGGGVYAYGGEGPYNAVDTTGGTATVNINSAGATTIENYAGVFANGGAGGAAAGTGAVMVNAAGPLNITGSSLYAYGGDGSEGGTAGNGTVNLISSSGIAIDNSEISANGGWGGGAGALAVQANGGDLLINNSYVYASGGNVNYSASSGDGGTGVVNLGSAGSTTITDSDVYAEGGSAAAYGGSSTVGGNGLVLVSAGGGLTVSNSILTADGGSAAAGHGGAAGLTMLAGGNIQFEGAEGSVYGGSGNVGGDAGILMVAGGNIVLDSYYYNTLRAGSGGNTPGASSVIVAAAGNVSLVNSASIYSDGVAGLGSTSANILLDNAAVYGDAGVSVGATGNLDLRNGSTLASYYGSTYVNTGGNVTVDNSSILGSPDVFMTVGGVVHMNNGGTIAAGAPTTIHVTFPMLTSGGYFVNGIEGVVSEGDLFDGGTGFFADGSGAILGTNLLVTYGGSNADTLNIPTDALIVAMGQSTKPPDPEKDKDVFEDLKKDKEKEAPVCR